jgi:hypothetical protein
MLTPREERVVSRAAYDAAVRDISFGVYFMGGSKQFAADDGGETQVI